MARGGRAHAGKVPAAAATRPHIAASRGRRTFRMPKNWEFVLAAYLIWGGAFAVYLGFLVRRGRQLSRALRQLGERGEPQG